ncbi:MAG: pilus assembly PilX family protein [Nitrospiraceae bacterium]
MKRNFVIHVAANQNGLALLTVMLLMLIMTVIGIGAITVTGLENRMAGYLRTGEAAASAAESCLGTGVNVIQQTIDQGSLPAAFLDNAAPAGPVPQANGPTLNQEIMGQSDNNVDVATVTPNTVATMNTFTVRGDIDRLYAKAKAGGSLQFAAGYEGTAGGAAGGGIDIFYRLNCVASNVATGTSSRIVAVYACTATGESCQKKI